MVSHDPKEDVFYSAKFAKLNFEKFVADKEAFRELYRDLVKHIAAGLWIERNLREKVLVWDTPSAVDRLLGAQLAEHVRNRAAAEVSYPLTRDCDVDQSRLLTDIEFDCYYCGWPYPALGELSGPSLEKDEGVLLNTSSLPKWELIPWKFE